MCWCECCVGESKIVRQTEELGEEEGGGGGNSFSLKLHMKYLSFQTLSRTFIASENSGRRSRRQDPSL